MKFKNLELGNLKDEQVLFFVRIHGKKGIFNQYYPKSLLSQFTSLTKYRTISEYSKSDFSINLNKIELSDIGGREYELFDNLLDYEAIIFRCRGLREISVAESRELIWKAAKYFYEFFKENTELRLIVSLITDNYVMEVMEVMAKYFKVENMQVIGFFVPGYFRIVEKGIGVKVREVTDQEVIRVYNHLILKSKSHFAVNKKVALKRALKDFLSYRYRFVVRYVLGYQIRNNLAYEYRFAKYFKGFHELKKMKANRYFTKLSDIRVEPSKTVFIPMHYHPEATVDYWVQEHKHADYLNSLKSLIMKCTHRGFKVLLKEHPAYYLRRDISFYQHIDKIKNVELLSPFESSQDVYDKVDNVIVYTGSAGVESMFLDKNVYTVSENYYSFGEILSFDDLGKKSKTYSEKYKKDLLRKILETTISND